MPEGLFNGALLLFFAQWSSEESSSWSVFSWIYLFCAVVFAAIMFYSAVDERQRYPQRWVRSIIYRICITAALVISNTDLIRLLVFVAYFPLAWSLTRGYEQHVRE
ncbi:MAG: hypothetical protein LKI28_05780 [Ancrocorticia sp.]|jgi:multisubunit Na+/H+ antiporter MnhE subunit|nr:hypothetical protein [Ancrocorticia sp.]